MTDEEVALALRALRRLRRGALQPDAAPVFLRPFIRHGLGPACGELAGWVRQAVSDPRGAEAVIRFFGLNRLPESLEQIGAGLIPSRPGRRAGIGPRQVEKLMSAAVAEMGRCVFDHVSASSEAEAPQLSRDPFPLPHDPATRRRADQALVWGWAQIPPGDRTAAAALLHYQREHGMRATAPVPSSRTERLRWRRLAWSVLHVATYRATLAAALPRSSAGDPEGIRLLAVTGGECRSDGLVALTAVSADPGLLSDPDLAWSALESVRTAVRQGRVEAPDLLRLLSDGANRYRATVGSVPPLLESKLIAVAAIVAREQRDPAGIRAARAGLRRIDELVESPAARGDHESWVWHVESGYRTSQELADLYTSLGRYAQARAAADAMRTRILRFGDPDPAQLPYGWHWNLLVTEASVNRHFARACDSPEPWWRAAAVAARHAAELGATAGLPASWALEAENEILEADLDRLADGRYRASRDGRRLLDEATRRLAQLDKLSQRIDDHQNRDSRRAKLRAKLLAWQLALLQSDPAAIQASRAQVRQALQFPEQPMLPIEVAAIARLRHASDRTQGGFLARAGADS